MFFFFFKILFPKPNSYCFRRPPDAPGRSYRLYTFSIYNTRITVYYNIANAIPPVTFSAEQTDLTRYYIHIVDHTVYSVYSIIRRHIVLSLCGCFKVGHSISAEGRVCRLGEILCRYATPPPSRGFRSYVSLSRRSPIIILVFVLLIFETAPNNHVYRTKRFWLQLLKSILITLLEIPICTRVLE